MMNGIMPTGNHHLGRGNNQSSSSSSWQDWSSDHTRERADWQPSAEWSSSDQTRERSVMAVRNEDLIHEGIYKGIHDDENSVWL